MIAVEVRAGRWADSARMMRAAREAEARDGVERAFVFMATPANLEQARSLGLDHPDLAGAGADDMVLAAQGPGAHAGLAAAAAAIDGGGAGEGVGDAAPAPASLAAVDADLAVISVPGEYAALEAHKALGRGMDVLLFSDGVGIEEEVALKRRAHRLGRLVMGPGAGTAIIAGVGLGFANVVRAGPVGVVAAAGSGAQEVTVLVDRLGSGVSACYGTGGRDMKDEVGAVTTLDAIGRLAQADDTEVVLCVSKPPSAAVAGEVVEALAATGKPAVACFVGAAVAGRDGVEVVPTLEAAAIAAVAATGLETAPLPEPAPPAPGRGFVRGLFSGGTLCGEAAAILAERLGRVTTNAPAGAAVALPPGGPIEGHAVLDLGEEEYTRGRPHPMIDPLARAELIVEQGAAPDVSVLLIDVVLGHGSHPDPAGALRDALRDALAANPELRVVAHVLGTEADPQPRSAQEAVLAALGRVTVCESNAIAARHAAALVGEGP